MNYLAHCYLSGENEELLVGNFIGDFIKGSLAQVNLPPAIIQGVRLHRQIDSFCEKHFSLQEVKKYLSSEQKRYASIIFDILNDHVLAKNWQQYSNLPLNTFCRQVYQKTDRYLKILPDKFLAVYQFIKRDDWLTSYRSQEITVYAINQTANKFQKPQIMQEALLVLFNHLPKLTELSENLLADLQKHLENYCLKN